MLTPRPLALATAALLALGACRSESAAVADPIVPTVVPDTTNRPFDTPAWATEANIYELNLRQYTPEGTFAAAKPHLRRLAAMGVDVVWMMPIYPISEARRKGTMGSYYASSDFRSVNHEFGTLEDFKDFVAEIHRLGMHVILDWTANHTGWDHPWIEQHPEFYVRRAGADTIRHAFNPNDAGGGDTDWYDIAQLDHANPQLDSAMIEDMVFWLRECDVDGFRCDVAGFVPLSFWQKVRPALEAVKPVFMLAEWGDEPRHFEVCFDINYGWEFHQLLNKLAEGGANADSVWAYQARDTATFPPYAYHLNFTSNHDENSWNGTEFERMGAHADAMWVVAATFEGAPLIYSGQEEPLKRRLAFFEKDDIGFRAYAKTDFFRRFLTLKHQLEALHNGRAGALASRVTLAVDDPQVLAYTRARGGEGIVVAVNLAGKSKTVQLAGGFAPGRYYDVMTGQTVALQLGSALELPAAGFRALSTLSPDVATE